MEENKGIEMGVEVEGVANLEPEEVVTVSEDAQEVPEETSITEQEKAGDSEPVESKFEKAFSKRLAKATEKVEEKVKGEYEPTLAKYRKVLEMGAKENGFENIEEYIEALNGESEDPSNDKPALDPESLAILEELKEKKSAEEFENERKVYWERQAKLLKDIGVTDMSQIPEEVLESALNNDTEIAYEYLKWDKQQAIKNAKKEVIREIQETETPGSLSGGGSDGVVDIKNLAWDDPEFDKILNDVKSGKRTRL